MKSIIGGLLLFFCSFSTIAQNSYNITGTLIDKSTGLAIDAATVSLLNAKDSSFVAGDMSNPKGSFSLKTPSKGNYLINVTFVGYKQVNQPVATTSYTTSTINLGNILLASEDILLKELIIEGKKPEIIVKNDTIEYDADSYKTPENAAVEDLLKKLPGVEVDKDGKITVNGKEVKKFLVDGKEFFSDDPQIASKNLPAEIVQKLQVVDRKSEMARMTGFNDGEEETIINLTIKPGMKKGMMGNASVGGGQDLQANHDGRVEAAALLNYMKNDTRYSLLMGGNNTNNLGAADLGAAQFGGNRGWGGMQGGITESQRIMFSMNKEFSPKLSLNGDVVYNTRDQNSATEIKETTIFSDTQSQLDKTVNKNNYISDNFNVRFRMEWKPDTSNTIIFRPNFQYNTSSNDQTRLAERFDVPSEDTIFQTASTIHNEGKGYNIGGNLDYSYKFHKPGRVLSASLKGSYRDSYSQGHSDQKTRFFNNNIFSRDSVYNKRTENDNLSNSYQIYASFVEPLKGNNFLQLAYSLEQYQSEDINSTYSIDGYDPLNTYPVNPVDTAMIEERNSRSTKRFFTEQRYSLKFKAVRTKYNYTIGINIDPTYSINKTYQPYFNSREQEFVQETFDGRLPNVMGDSLISKLDQKVVNFSPEIDFNYLFGERSNLRIDYDGNTIQPTANQLRDYTDESDFMNLVRGNPNLKPGYTNELRARFNKSIPESQIFYNVNLMANLSFNDITSVTRKIGEIRETTYENINGNWDTRLMVGFNTPLKNKKFTLGNFAMAYYANRKSFVNENENTLKNLSLSDRVNIDYRSALFDLGINGNIRYGNIQYDLQPENNQETFDWGAGASTTWYLPHNTTLESDINWSDRNGYADGFNISQTIWNASITKQLFNKKYGTGSLKLKIYDILQDRNSVTASSTTNGYRSTMSTTIPSFFMCTFIYKFSIFPGGSSATEKDVRGERNWGRQGRGPEGGRPGSMF